MHFDAALAAAGALVGFTVGLTGMGGGALMTPILVLVFGVHPGTAVSSDLLASLVMKPVGATVHFRKGTVNWGLARWLCIGSVPAAAAGVFVLNHLGDGPEVSLRIKSLLGWALVVAAAAMVARALLGLRSRPGGDDRPPVALKRVATVLIGVAGGFIVGMTSVGSGSLMIVMLLLLYPQLSARELVGTDLVQAIPLVGAATLSHALFGHVDVGLTGSLLVGSLPGVYLGARVSSRAPDVVIRPALVVILLASALKLLQFSNEALGATLLLVVLVGAPLWAAVDASVRPAWQWDAARLRRTTWVTAPAVAAPFLVGFPVAVYYAAVVRRRLPTAPLVAEPVRAARRFADQSS
ncbi:MAG TPA: sulfite exporter TauE/SafE family protein [Acidimicrobiales bacterium]|nr:sulfite exporter TauE/SafE family protein [Acidimicrobiales bacterium]